MKLIKKDGIVYADSREVAELIDKTHAHLCRDIDSYVNILYQNPKLDSDNFFIESSYTAGTGKAYKCYLLTKKGCDMVANKMTGDKGILFTATYVDKFYEMEHQLVNKNTLALPNFNNPAEAARAWANEYEAKQKALAKVDEMKPKVLFAEAVESSKTSILVGELAKIIKQNGVDIGEKRFFAWLRDNGYLISRKSSDWNMPTQRSMKLGLFEIKERNIFNPDGSVRITKTPKVTGKGQTYFINKFLNETA